MTIRIGNPRVGHRVGGFYVRGTVTGPNAGRQFRVGHRLPGGSYASALVQVDSSRHPQRPIGAVPLSGMLAITVAYGGIAVALLCVGLWILALPLLVATMVCWLKWAANPQQRRPASARAYEESR